MTDSQKVKRVILDTNYWIDFVEEYPERTPRFLEAIDNDDVKVYITFGNFIDLIRSNEQEGLTKLILGASDHCIPSTILREECVISNNIIDLIPSENHRRNFSQVTQDMDTVETFQEIIKHAGWSASDWYYSNIKRDRELLEEHGYDELKNGGYKEYLQNEHGSQYNSHGVETVSDVRHEVFLQRLRVMTLNENIREQDVADLETCTQAIASECNMLLIEKKWVNVDLIQKTIRNLDSEKDMTVYKDFEKFLSDLKQ
ncbi:hypothetical protein [Halorubrum depositum]|uniref:hypothetical protein n=1 Tax=Halorubrum depositum TaxID=2583992 RepID=UPI00119DD5FB|nr:hypothetical protein [Halorubrum depositum]